MLETIAGEFGRSIVYVVTAPFFWQAMAVTTIVAMIIGTLVYNGDLDKLWRATLAIITYGLLIVGTSVTRTYSLTGFHFEEMLQGQGLAGTTTILLVTAFYVFGLYLGYTAHKLAQDIPLTN